MQAKRNIYVVDETNRLILDEALLVKFERLTLIWPIPTNLVHLFLLFLCLLTLNSGNVDFLTFMNSEHLFSQFQYLSLLVWI